MQLRRRRDEKGALQTRRAEIDACISRRWWRWSVACGRSQEGACLALNAATADRQSEPSSLARPASQARVACAFTQGRSSWA